MRQTVLASLLRNNRQPKLGMPAGWAGVVGCDDPAGKLACIVSKIAWSDSGAAFCGPVACDRTESVIVCGDVVLDNASELRRLLETAETDPLCLFAELFHWCGPDSIKHARGMYSAAVWQPAEHKLTLLRDAVGARTVYYTADGRSAWFASRLNTLRKSPAVSGALSLPALRNYLTCAYVPGEDTMWRDALEVRPGSAVLWPDRQVRSIWQPNEGEYDRGESLERAAARLRPLLEDAVQSCMPRDEPVGVYLSGGLDSSLVTALAARLSSKPVYSYAIHFGDEYRNELEFSSMVANHCGTRHRIIELTGKQIRDTLFESIAALDDPIGDPLTTPNLILGQTAARDVGVILNGEGGDPCFGGPKNLPMMLFELYGSEGREQAYLRAYQKCYDDLPQLLTHEVQSSLRNCPPQEEMFAQYLGPESGMSHYLNRLMLMNTLLKGADNILTKVNNLTSANGLLGRSPLFDRRIVEASFATPPEYKQAGAVEKAILKKAVEDLLPAAILTRPKSGMLVPVQGWFRKDLRRMAKGMLISRHARIRPYIRQDLVKDWLAYRGSLWPRHGVKLWLILTLEVWLRANE